MLNELARLAESSASVTSGVRVSVSTVPPFKVAEAEQSLSVASSPSPNTLELAGVPRRMSWPVVAIISLAVFGAAAFAAREVIDSRRTVNTAQPRSTATPTAQSTAPTVPPPPPEPTAPASSNEIPSVSAEQLPKATTPTSGPIRHAGRGPTPKPPVTPSTAQKPGPAPTASQGYGYLE
jgi:hypothetical protein